LTFSGECRADEHTKHHIHESPPVMTIPLIVLAFLAIVGGVVGIPFLEGGSKIHSFLSPAIGHASHSAAGPAEAGHSSLEFILMGVSVGAGALGIFLAALMYYAPLRSFAPSFWTAENMAGSFSGIHKLLYNKYYVDEIYDAIIINPIKRFCGWCLSFDLGIIDGIVNGAAWITRLLSWVSHKFDIYIVDGLVNSMATFVNFNSSVWRRLQTGYLQNYAFIFVLGVLIALVRALLG
ncbi:MAG: hypothetical protein AAB197_05190, partial [Deltaproteobacteria bacterium]